LSNQHIDTLTAARQLLVGHRRALAKILATSTDNRGFDSRAKLIEIQATIEAIDRAIADESTYDGGAPAPSR
jgi:hypothetical protein